MYFFRIVINRLEGEVFLIMKDYRIVRFIITLSGVFCVLVVRSLLSVGVL